MLYKLTRRHQIYIVEVSQMNLHQMTGKCRSTSTLLCVPIAITSTPWYHVCIQLFFRHGHNSYKHALKNIQISSLHKLNLFENFFLDK